MYNKYLTVNIKKIYKHKPGKKKYYIYVRVGCPPQILCRQKIFQHRFKCCVSCVSHCRCRLLQKTMEAVLRLHQPHLGFGSRPITYFSSKSTIFHRQNSLSIKRCQVRVIAASSSPSPSFPFGYFFSPTLHFIR